MLPPAATNDNQESKLTSLEESKQNKNDLPVDDVLKQSIGEKEEATFTSPALLAWSSYAFNKISIIELETKQSYANFDGAQIADGYWTHVKEIPGTKLLVSLNFSEYEPANMEIFDISKKEVTKIYSFEEVSGITGYGDVTFNTKRSILGAISLQGKIAYHLWKIEDSGKKNGFSVKLLKKVKWPLQYSTEEENYVTSLDLSPSGELMATLDSNGICLITDANTDDYNLQLKIGGEWDFSNRCRWSPNIGEPLLFVKYNKNKLKILDVEKKALTSKNPIQTEKQTTYWIDVCQSNENLLAFGGQDKIVNIFDKRESKIVQTFDSIHTASINCVRWDPIGCSLASASEDKTVKLLDFKTGKVLYTGTTSDGQGAYSVCFI